MYKVYLKPNKEESLKRFHPWVFSGAIAHFDGEPEEGEVVEIYPSFSILSTRLVERPAISSPYGKPPRHSS